ncbi:hypothetical protein P9314_09515 [Paenibacillus validus]|uniref:Uncharacterized protein n=1 Tax=Paenibacillus validus TaxID=44253 RepID=A0A7X3CVD3_9BACL|nr:MULTISPECIES: hypothetical protein [Paenibacillus]MED4600937.1 hypothetical protein [Paenibacillus validus]MED4607231.1 hypothetical protein [Paenibacillus validus]MUG73676.1 hypothetical protein [Paenibacillus validus]
MRTENQVKRKLNELLMQKKTLESRLENEAAGADNHPLRQQIDRLDEQIMLLEWVLNEPVGSYHA